MTKMDEDDGKGKKSLYDTPWAHLPLPGVPIGPNSWLTVKTASDRLARRLAAANLDDAEEIMIPAHLREPKPLEPPPPPAPTIGQRLKQWLRRVLLRRAS
jgi:hypothetical protein